MKIVLQRVENACVKVGGETVGKIGKGYLALLGITHSDTKETVEKAVDKIAKLRIFSDADGKTNLSSVDIGGEILVVSQFTLYADCRKGNRPSFTDAANPEHANSLYEYFVFKCKDSFKKTACGIFGADMSVTLTNDGPFTVVVEF